VGWIRSELRQIRIANDEETLLNGADCTENAHKSLSKLRILLVYYSAISSFIKTTAISYPGTTKFQKSTLKPSKTSSAWRSSI